MSEQVDLSVAGCVADLRRRVAALERMERHVGAYGCGFLAYNSATDTLQTGNGATPTVDFDTEVFDLGADFAADTFTAPVDGEYRLHAEVLMSSLTAAMDTGYLRLVTSNRSYYGNFGNWGAMRTGGDLYTARITALCDMDAADTAYVIACVSNGAGDTAGIYGHATAVYTYFCGYRVA